jgi:hypothetical protein
LAKHFNVVFVLSSDSSRGIGTFYRLMFLSIVLNL